MAEDEREAGRRTVLNLGHTFGHAIERTAGFGRVPHGEAVAVGLALAVEASARSGLLAEPRLGTRLAALLERLGLAATLPDLRERHRTPLPADELAGALLQDKKRAGGRVRFVLLAAPGDPRPGHALEPELVRALLA